jgi:hypothetical protein
LYVGHRCKQLHQQNQQQQSTTSATVWIESLSKLIEERWRKEQLATSLLMSGAIVTNDRRRQSSSPVASRNESPKASTLLQLSSGLVTTPTIRVMRNPQQQQEHSSDNNQQPITRFPPLNSRAAKVSSSAISRGSEEELKNLVSVVARETFGSINNDSSDEAARNYESGRRNSSVAARILKPIVRDSKTQQTAKSQNIMEFRQALKKRYVSSSSKR